MGLQESQGSTSWDWVVGLWSTLDLFCGTLDLFWPLQNS